MKAVIAIDSFKGCLSSSEANDAVERGILRAFPDAETVKIPVADGGEGTADALVGALGGVFKEAEVHGPLGEPIKARYGIVTVEGKKCAVIESAAAIGLPLVPEDRRNPMKTSSFGLGELILSALRGGCRRLLVGLGGSSTVDGGVGMLSALGYRFFDREGVLLSPCSGESMTLVASIDSSLADPLLREAEFILACDVNTVFSDAPSVFGPQKGATPPMVEALTEGMLSLSSIIKRKTGIDISRIPGGGAAGGLGAAFSAFLNADLKRGIDLVLDTLGFDSSLAGADVVITGEGRIDLQTSLGKAPSGILRRVETVYGGTFIPIIAFCGSFAGGSSPFTRIIPVSPPEMPLSEAMDPKIASENLSEAAYKYFVDSRDIFLKNKYICKGNDRNNREAN